MGHEPKKHLFDIIQAGELIVQFTSGKTLEQYRNDAQLRSAVERQFQIIGEALQQLHRGFPDVAEKITYYRSIIDFRRILVHGYDRVEDDIVWGIIESRLPALLSEAEMLLGK